MMKVIKRFLLAVIVTGIVAVSWVIYQYQANLDSPISLLNETQYFNLQPGGNVSRELHKLAKEQKIIKPTYLLWHIKLSGKGTRIQAGEYEITPGMRVREFLDNLYTGKVTQYGITLVEGWSFKQMLEVIHNHPQLKHQLTGLSAEQIMSQLGHAGEHPEGRFMPDTYHFPRGMTDISLLQQAYQSMNEFLDKAWPERQPGLPYKSPYEALIMASIVEKETGLASEREAIAGVFVRRLEKRMRLQTDPTVIYGMGDRYKGNIRKSDLLTDTPYNTYTRSGLPPTPIAMPGREAIRAALNPEQASYLYFVSKGDGSHHFSSTLEEHNEAVIKYQLNGRRKSFSSYPNK